jgi:FkbM family methyltransferase
MKTKIFDRFIEIAKEDGLINLIYKSIIFLIVRFSPPEAKINYFFTKLFFGSTVKEVLGSKMILDLKNDEGLSKDLFLIRKREINLTNYLMNSNILKKGDIVLDIGANRGYYTLITSKIVEDSGKVYAIEPVGLNFNILKKNIELNSCKNVELYRLAIGDKNWISKINVSRVYNICTMLPSTDENIIGQETVEEVTVDSFVEGKDIPNLIRMDVEGYEYQIIKGMKSTLKNDLRIIMETHPDIMDEKQLRDMFKQLKENNFEIENVILDPPAELLDSDGRLNPLVTFLKRRIGVMEEYGFLDMNIDEVLEWMLLKKETPNLIFVKRGIK